MKAIKEKKALIIATLLAIAFIATTALACNTNQTKTLANGEPITTENVLAIMENIHNEYPLGTSYWTEFVPNGSTLKGDVKDLLHQFNATSNGVTGKTDLSVACGGYARYVSDSIFGRTGFPARELITPPVSDLRPGDIIITFNDDGTLKHVSIVWKVAQDEDGTWRYNTTDAANRDIGVTWTLLMSDMPPSDKQRVFTRYPG